MPHSVLCVHCHRAMGRSDHLQDQEALPLPAGNEVSALCVWIFLWGGSVCFCVCGIVVLRTGWH